MWKSEWSIIRSKPWNGAIIGYHKKANHRLDEDPTDCIRSAKRLWRRNQVQAISGKANEYFNGLQVKSYAITCHKQGGQWNTVL
jgi:hypothetical protein